MRGEWPHEKEKFEFLQYADTLDIFEERETKFSLT